MSVSWEQGSAKEYKARTGNVLEDTTRAGGTMSVRIPVARLSALGRLWAKVKLFHPYLATRDIDWDAALVSALPKVRSAETAEQYRAAVDEMLAALGDPETQTSIQTTKHEELGSTVAQYPPSDDHAALAAPLYFRVAGEVVVLSCNEIARLLDRDGAGALKRAVPTLKDELNKAKGVILDCRIGARRSQPGSYFAFNNYLRETVSGLLDRPVTLGTYRYREHSGHIPHTGFTSGDYGSSLATAVAAVLPGHSRARECPPLAVIIEDRTRDLRSLWGGLQSAGLATIVLEGSEGPSTAIALRDEGFDLKMTDGITVWLRTTEFVYPNGRIGWEPNVRVLVTTLATGRDAALDAALTSIEGGKKAKPAGIAHATAPRRQLEKTYGDMAFLEADYRLLALFRFWTVIEHFFPYKHLMDRDWSTVLADYIPKFDANRSALDYETTVLELAVRLQDSHVNVGNARSLEEHRGLFSPALSVGFVQNETAITALRDKRSANAAGLALGDIVLAIDNEPVEERRERIAHLIPSSTPQALRRAVNGHLLRGPKDRVARLRIRDADGREREVAIPRTEPWRSVVFPPDRSAPAVCYGYIDLSRLALADVDKAMAAVERTPALIFDMRGYPLGTVWVMAPRLALGDERIIGALFRRPYWRGDRIGDDGTLPPDHAFADVLPLSSAEGSRYTGKVVMLINELAQSQAEHTCMLFAARTDVTFIGSPTAGANGDITNFALPGNLVVTFTGHDVRHPDGRQLQRVGIQPHVSVEPTILGIREGRDEVLEAAVRHLQRRL
jgi:hypothetical protein